jgi:L-2,4-diaminobutyrate transaminase
MTLDRAHNISLEDMDRESIFHPATSIADHLEKGPMIMAEAKGLRLKDTHGKDYLDCGSGLWCVNVGYGREEIADAAAKAIRDLSFHHMFGGNSNEAMIRLADKVLDKFHNEADAPHLSKIFFGTSGSDANDTIYKLVRYYNNLRGRPEKKKVISRIGAYHGLTYVATSLTGIEGYHKAFDTPIEGIFHTSCPHYYRFHEHGESEEEFCNRMIADLEALIEREGRDTIAAFWAEPIMGTGGTFIPPKDYFTKVQKILDANDILFVADEVITGFGRTGSWFATGLYDLKPDFVTLAKGITSAYYPVSGVAVSERVWQVLKEESPKIGPVMHGFTYSGHPVGGAIGMANLEIMERENLPENARIVGAYLKAELNKAVGGHPYIGEIRGQGLMMGIELVADKEKRRWFDVADGAHKVLGTYTLAEGLLSRPLPMIEVLGMAPPLCMTKSEADEAVERFSLALEKATPDLDRLANK